MWIFFGLIGLLGVIFLVALLAGSNAHRHDGPTSSSITLVNDNNKAPLF